MYLSFVINYWKEWDGKLIKLTNLVNYFEALPNIFGESLIELVKQFRAALMI